MGYVKIYAGSFIIVQLISKNLEDCGITAVIKDETESARLAGFGPTTYGHQEVFVHESEEGSSKTLWSRMRPSGEVSISEKTPIFLLNVTLGNFNS